MTLLGDSGGGSMLSAIVARWPQRGVVGVIMTPHSGRRRLSTAARLQLRRSPAGGPGGWWLQVRDCYCGGGGGAASSSTPAQPAAAAAAAAQRVGAARNKKGEHNKGYCRVAVRSRPMMLLLLVLVN